MKAVISKTDQFVDVTFVRETKRYDLYSHVFYDSKDRRCTKFYKENELIFSTFDQQFVDIKNALVSLISKITTVDSPIICTTTKERPDEKISTTEIRIKIGQFSSCNYHARHLFGHWLCCLHAYGIRYKNIECCEQVADLIAGAFRCQ
ncbi:MAG: hypothetical protein Q7R33_02910 [Nitrosarchaeum sp.]|nr:hypothetical protein [Nitrosarchaeum sp.]